MKLYTCGQKGKGGSLPWPATHPCGGDARAKIRELTGQDNVPVLQLDDGTTIVDSGDIKRWVGERSASG